MISQTTHFVCAHCGVPSKHSNDPQSIDHHPDMIQMFNSSSMTRVYFKCPHCTVSYLLMQRPHDTYTKTVFEQSEKYIAPIRRQLTPVRVSQILARWFPVEYLIEDRVYKMTLSKLIPFMRELIEAAWGSDYTEEQRKTDASVRNQALEDAALMVEARAATFDNQSFGESVQNSHRKNAHNIRLLKLGIEPTLGLQPVKLDSQEPNMRVTPELMEHLQRQLTVTTQNLGLPETHFEGAPNGRQ